MKDTVENLRQELPSHPCSNAVDTHPSYGMVSINRQQCSGDGRQLFGSGIRHNTMINLCIKKARRLRDEYYDHYSAKEQLIEILLSPAQFTAMITNMNTEGTPCTLAWLKDEGRIEEPPIHNIKQEINVDLDRKYRQVSKSAALLLKDLDILLSGTVKKSDKEKIKSRLYKVEQEIRSNLPYLQKCHTEKLEDIGIQVVAEAESAITGMINKLGLKELQKQISRKGNLFLSENFNENEIT